MLGHRKSICSLIATYLIAIRRLMKKSTRLHSFREMNEKSPGKLYTVQKPAIAYKYDVWRERGERESGPTT